MVWRVNPFTGNFDETSNFFNFQQWNTSFVPDSEPEGQTWWNPTDHTLNIATGRGPVLQAGQEDFLPFTVGCNETGSVIENGKAVYITNNGSKLTIAKANSRDPNINGRTVGITTESIDDTECGFVTMRGLVRNVDTSSFSLGDSLYVSETNDGELTNVKPTGGDYPIRIGIVHTVGTTDGVIFMPYLDIRDPADIKNNCGFPQQNAFIKQSDASFTNVDRTFRLAPNTAGGYDSYYVWQLGQKYLFETEQSVQIPDEEGTFWIYFDDGVMNYIKDPTQGDQSTLIREKVLIAMVYWNATDKEAVIIGDERHGHEMSGDTHAYFHFADGARWISGLAMSNVVADGSGNDDASAQFGVDSGVITDEDLLNIIGSIGSTEGLPIMYLDGSGGYLRRTTQTGVGGGFSVLTDVQAGIGATGRLVWNEQVGGVWQLTTVANNDFVLCHVFACNSKQDPVIAFVGQGDYATIGQARAGASTEISTIQTNYPSPELVPLATFIFQTRDIYTNSVKSRVRTTDEGDNYVDWRSTELTPGSSPSSHPNLATLNWADAGHTIDTNFLPNADASYDLGSDSFSWKSGYFESTNFSTTLNNESSFVGVSSVDSNGYRGELATFAEGVYAEDNSGNYVSLCDGSYALSASGDSDFGGYNIGNISEITADLGTLATVASDYIYNSNLIESDTITAYTEIYTPYIGNSGGSSIISVDYGTCFDNSAGYASIDWDNGYLYEYDGSTVALDWRTNSNQITIQQSLFSYSSIMDLQGVLYVDGGGAAVGINQPSPGYELDVAGTSHATRMSIYDSSIPEDYLYFNNGSDYLLFEKGGGYFLFSQGMRFPDNRGIEFGDGNDGTISSDGTDLNFYGNNTNDLNFNLFANYNFDNNVTILASGSPYLRIQGQQSSIPSIVFAEDANDAYTIKYDGSGSGSSNNKLVFDSYWNANVFSMDGDGLTYFKGYVGIGINPAVTPLHIYQNDSNLGSATGLTLEQDGTGDTGINFLITGTTRWVNMVDNSRADALVWAPSSSVNLPSFRMNVDKTIDIGSSPSYSQSRKFRVYDDGVNGGARISLIGTGTNTTYPALEMVLDGDVNQRLLYRMEKESSTEIGTSIWTTTGGAVSRKFYFAPEGYFGINTSNPLKRLHVSDGSTSGVTGGAQDSILITDATIPRIYFEDLSESVGDKLVGISYYNQEFVFGSMSDSGAAYDTEKIMTIHRDGDVEISTGDLTVSGELTAGSGSDTTHQLGEAIIGYNGHHSGAATFANDGFSTQYNYALRQGASGETRINTPTGQTVQVRINNTNEYDFSATQLDLKGNNLTTTGTIQGSFKSSDGTAGITQTETGVTNFDIVIKDGIITSFTKN